MIESTKFARKPFYVDAVQVTVDNIEDVAEWCQGDVRTSEKTENNDDEKYVKVRVHRPLTDRQTKAFLGDWVLYAGTGFKVYTNKAFEKSFEPTEETVMHNTGAGHRNTYRNAEAGEVVEEDFTDDNSSTTVKGSNPIFKKPVTMRSDADLS